MTRKRNSVRSEGKMPAIDLQDRAQPPNDEDFEFVHSQAHDHDDLSSLASGSGHTDNESDTDPDDSQANSDVTLQMPSLDDAAEYMEEAGNSMTQDTPHAHRGLKAVGPSLHTTLPYASNSSGHFDIKAGERVELPILYLGAHEYKEAVLSKLAETLYPNFTSDVWESSTYSIYKASGAQGVGLCVESAIAFRICKNLAEIGKAGSLFLVIVAGNPSKEALNLLEDLQRSFSPILYLEENEVTDAGVDLYDSLLSRHSLLFTMRTDHTLDDRVVTSNFRPLTIDEFLRLPEDEISGPVMKSLDSWQVRASHDIGFPGALQRIRRASWSALSLWLLVLMLAVPTIYNSLYTQGSLSRHENRLFPNSNSSSSILTFHQITETNAIIELPLHYRSVESGRIPKINASVSRDGKPIKSRVQLIVDNLYSLDWAHSEAHGELVVAAELLDQKEKLTDAYVVQYSTTTSFLHAVTEKLRDLNRLGHLTPEVDLPRRVQDLMKQVEDSRSFVVKASKHQLESLKEQGSLGLRRLQKDYTTTVRDASKNWNAAIVAGRQFSETARTRLLDQVEMARIGLHRLRSHGQKPASKSTHKRPKKHGKDRSVA